MQATDGAPRVRCDHAIPGLAVTDLAAAIAFYTAKLGFRSGFSVGEPPTMASVELGNAQVFLQCGTPAPQGHTLYFVVDDVDALHAWHRAHGVDVVSAPDDTDYGMREYAVRDLDGHLLSFGQATHADDGPPLPIERVDLHVRLERRLAALLQDLAAHRRMSVSGCLEEILLHTNDGVTPHTAATLEHIRHLKERHGVDYDTHASYRFVEP